MTSKLFEKQILVVEDEMLIACEIAMVVEEAGAHTIGPAPTLEKALMLIEEQDCAAAVLDVRLGADEVFAAARRLAEKKVPFLFHTGHADAALLSEWTGVPIVKKPAPPAELIRVLESLVANPDGGADLIAPPPAPGSLPGSDRRN